MKKYLYTLMGTLFLMLTVFNVKAQQFGSPDNSFGTGGMVTTSIDSINAYATSIALQNDGKIVAAGPVYNNTQGFFGLARYNANGTLDATFNPTGSIPGVVRTNISFISLASAVAIQSDGKLVVAGVCRVSNDSANKLALARYNTNGSLDVTFNPAGSLPGTVKLAIGSSAVTVSSVVIQSNGKIIVGGSSDLGFTLARYNTNGSIDVTFNAQGIKPGILTTSIPGFGLTLQSMALQNDGKIVACGYIQGGPSQSYVLARYKTYGILDSTFNATGPNPGIVCTSIGNAGDFCRSIKIQNDGKIVACGSSNFGSGYSISLARYLTNGTLDNNFGTGGTVTTTATSNWSEAMALGITPFGIIACGYYTNNGNNDMILERFNSDGSQDTTIGIGGKVIISTGLSTGIYSAALVSNWKIVVGGGTVINSKPAFLLAKYWCGKPALIVSANLPADTICQAGTTLYTIHAIGDSLITYQWYHNNNAITPSDYDTIFFQHAALSDSGNYFCIASNFQGKDTSNTSFLVVNPAFTAPVITQNGNVLLSSVLTQNQWYDQNGIINGAINQYYVVTTAGDYYTICTTLRGCISDTSNILQVILTGIKEAGNNIKFTLFPNPISDNLTIEITGNRDKVDFEISDLTGQIIYKGYLVDKTTIATASFAAGMYIIKLTKGKTIVYQKIIKV